MQLKDIQPLPEYYGFLSEWCASNLAHDVSFSGDFLVTEIDTFMYKPQQLTKRTSNTNLSELE